MALLNQRELGLPVDYLINPSPDPEEQVLLS